MYERWARWWVRRYLWALDGRPYLDAEDIYQAAMLGILRALEGYSADKGSWANYSSFFIRQEIRGLLGIKQGRLPPLLQSLDAPAGDDPEGETRLDLLPDETAPSPEDVAELSALQKGVREAVERLPDPTQRRVIELHKLGGKSITETAKALGISSTDAHREYCRARKNLAADKRFHALREEQPYFLHWGLSRFFETGSSAVEMAVLWREREGGEQRE